MSSTRPVICEVFPRKVLRHRQAPHVGRFVGVDGGFDYRFKAPNGAKIGGSGGQGYTSRRDAHRALTSFLTRIGATNYVIRDVTDAS